MYFSFCAKNEDKIAETFLGTIMDYFFILTTCTGLVF